MVFIEEYKAFIKYMYLILRLCTA